MTTTFDYRKKQFSLECKAINLRYEYENYTGEERYAIITALSREELLDKYADIMDNYSPFVLLTLEQGAAITEHQNNDAKFRMRGLLYGHAYDINDGEFEEHHPELAASEDIIEQIDKKDKLCRIRKLLNGLPEIQKRRLIKHFFYNKSSREIAKEEGVNYSTVDKSIAAGIEKIKKLF